MMSGKFMPCHCAKFYPRITNIRVRQHNFYIGETGDTLPWCPVLCIVLHMMIAKLKKRMQIQYNCCHQ